MTIWTITRYPVIQAPMAGGATTPELIAAVSNAGGLGSLGAGYLSPVEIRAAIKQIRALTDKPFAVNLFIPEQHAASDEQLQQACLQIEKACHELNLKIAPAAKPYAPNFEEQIKIILEEQVPVFSFTFGMLDSLWIQKLTDNGIVIIGTATTLAEASLLAARGVDMIVAQGCEAGGHRGTFVGAAENSLIPLRQLISKLVAVLKIPVIAAGGIMNGQHITATLKQGANAVQMGTAFLTCRESGVNADYKKMLLSLTDDQTTLTTAFSGKLARGLKNKFITRMENQLNNILSYPIQNALTRSMRKEAEKQHCVDFMSIWAGQAAQYSRGIPAGDLIRQLVEEINKA